VSGTLRMLDILLIMVMHHMKVARMKILVLVALEWFVVQYSLDDNLEGDSDPVYNFLVLEVLLSNIRSGGHVGDCH
jgi:hypothetical protein